MKPLKISEKIAYIEKLDILDSLEKVKESRQFMIEDLCAEYNKISDVAEKIKIFKAVDSHIKHQEQSPLRIISEIKNMDSGKIALAKAYMQKAELIEDLSAKRKVKKVFK